MARTNEDYRQERKREWAFIAADLVVLVLALWVML